MEITVSLPSSHVQRENNVTIFDLIGYCCLIYQRTYQISDFKVRF